VAGAVRPRFRCLLLAIQHRGLSIFPRGPCQVRITLSGLSVRSLRRTGTKECWSSGVVPNARSGTLSFNDGGVTTAVLRLLVGVGLRTCICESLTALHKRPAQTIEDLLVAVWGLCRLHPRVGSSGSRPRHSRLRNQTREYGRSQ